MQKAQTVTEITLSIKKNLESGYSCIYIRGEISNFKDHSSGHYYFTLKDETSQLSAVFFSTKNKDCSFKPKDGDKVVVKGGITVFPPRGTYQILVEEMKLDGVGSLLVKLHELKEKLAQEGLFDQAYKKKIPFLPKTIGVITSPTGAVIQDMIHVLSRRYPGFTLLLNPVRVQGEGASQEIAQAIHEMNQYALADVLIIARGGGSLEDLWPFNEEKVVRAIYHSKIPVVSAVGHETDYTLSDFAADVRAPTPSAAAEMVLPEKEKLLLTLGQKKQSLQGILARHLEGTKQKLKALTMHPYLQMPEKFLTKYAQALDFANDRLEMASSKIIEGKKNKFLRALGQLEAHSPQKNLRHMKEKLESYKLQIGRQMHQAIKRKENELTHLYQKLEAINPQKLLEKGYAILFEEKTQSVIFSLSQLQNPSQVYVQLSDGKAFGHLQPFKED